MLTLLLFFVFLLLTERALDRVVLLLCCWALGSCAWAVLLQVDVVPLTLNGYAACVLAAIGLGWLVLAAHLKLLRKK